MRFVVKTKNVCAHVNIVNFILLMFLCTKLLHCNKLYLLLNSIKKIVYIVVDSCIFLYDKIINIAVFKEIHTHISNNSIPAIYILISIWKLCKNDFDCICPRVKVFYDLKNLSEGINKAEYGRNMPKETKNRSR
jgi:hypothetical protein